MGPWRSSAISRFELHISPNNKHWYPAHAFRHCPQKPHWLKTWKYPSHPQIHTLIIMDLLSSWRNDRSFPEIWANTRCTSLSFGPLRGMIKMLFVIHKRVRIHMNAVRKPPDEDRILRERKKWTVRMPLNCIMLISSCGPLWDPFAAATRMLLSYVWGHIPMRHQHTMSDHFKYIHLFTWWHRICHMTSHIHSLRNTSYFNVCDTLFILICKSLHYGSETILQQRRSLKKIIQLKKKRIWRAEGVMVFQ